ncbi:MAG: response regulator [Saprospirales bacterium]|jgi:CRP-like cAMP-binding protein|nr:response regulator [Saprospirales bacterium]MBK8920804.1 response regulator [Saprospirales bacterium]
MKKILIIEDNTEVRENLSEILSLSGYHTVTAENGKAGVEKALSDHPDLVLCDVMMPELDGFGVLHILSKQAATADIPFIFLTAKAEKDDFRKGMSLGADDYIVKPFDDTILLQTIETRLRKNDRLRQASNKQNGGGLEHFINEAKALEAIQRLSENREIRHYRKKDPIFQEGEVPRWLFYVEKGNIKIYKTNDDGRELILRIAGPGEFLGYLALLRDDRYPESAASLEDTTIRLIPKDDFFTLVYGHRDVNARFIKLLAGHVAEQEQQLIDLAYNSVRKRVATAIIHLFDQGFREINLLREDLAALAGTAKETVIRTLTDFKNEGLIDIREGFISVIKADRLRDMPN